MERAPAVALGPVGAPFFSTFFFLASASFCACADRRQGGSDDTTSAQATRPMATPARMRSVDTDALRSLRGSGILVRFQLFWGRRRHNGGNKAIRWSRGHSPDGESRPRIDLAPPPPSGGVHCDRCTLAPPSGRAMLHVFTICDDMASRRRQPKERGLPIDHARARNPQDLLLCDNGGTRAPSIDRTVARTPEFRAVSAQELSIRQE